VYFPDPDRVRCGGRGGRGAGAGRPGRLASRGIGLSKRVVYLDRWDGGRFEPVRAELTGPRGGVSFPVWPGVTARYELVYRGSDVFAPTHSGVVTVRVIR
jgi:hypothetical protein